MGCPLEVFFLGLISTQLLWKGVVLQKLKGYELNAPANVLVEEGLCAIIPCNFTYDEKVKNDAPLHGFWKKGTTNRNDLPFVARSTEPSPQNRFQLIGDLRAQNCSLLILNAQISDTGNYFFRMEKEHGPKFSYLKPYTVPHLNVKERKPPEIKIMGTLREGNHTNITCATFASCSRMPPTFTWSISSKHMNSHRQLNGITSVLNFLPSVADHKQNLTCKVTYRNEETSVSKEGVIQLNVTFPPQIPVIKGEHIQSNKSQENFTNRFQFTVQIGDSIWLRCEANGNPLPNVTWIKGTQVLERPSPASNDLKLSDLNLEDAGKYTCWADNDQGINTTSLELSVTDPVKRLLLTAAGVLAVLVVLIIGSILAYKRYWRKRKTVTGSEIGNTLANVKKHSALDRPVQEVNGISSKVGSTEESVDRNPRDPEEIHYATLTFNAPNPNPDKAAEFQTDYAEIRPYNSQGKEA